MLNIYVKTRVGKALNKQGKHIDNLSTGAYRIINKQNVYNNYTIWRKSSRNRNVILQTYYAIYVILKNLTAQDKNDDYITILNNRTQCVEVMTNSIRIWGEDGWPVSKFSYLDAYNYAKQHHLPHVYLNKVPSNYYSYKPLFSLLQALYSILITFHHIHFKMCNIEDPQFKKLSDYLNVPYITKHSPDNVHRQYYLLSTKVSKDLKQSFINNCKRKSVNYQNILKSLIIKYIKGNLNGDDKNHKLKAQLTKTLNKINDLKESNHKQKIDNKKVITSLKKKMTNLSNNSKKATDLKKGVKHLEKIVDYDNNEIKKANGIITADNKQVGKANKIIKRNTSNKGNNKNQYVFKPDKNADEKLNQMIGLKDVKQQILDYIAEIKIAKRSKQLGQKSKIGTMNLIFEGNPGTGKTQVAKLFPSILYNHHVIKEPIFVKANISDMQRAMVHWGAGKKMDNAINSALGGVLFIDEAYMLNRQGEANESIITELIKGAENYRGKLIIILAGYPHQMNELLNKTNPGFKSRFNTIIMFPDYNETDMLRIFNLMAENNNFIIPKYNHKIINKDMHDLITYAHNHHIRLSNGRTVRNVVDAINKAKVERLAHKDIEDMDKLHLDTVEVSDIVNGFNTEFSNLRATLK